MTRGYFLIGLLFLWAWVGFGQVDSNAIVVEASRTVYFQGDRANLAITVGSGPTASLDDIVAAIAGAGVTKDNFIGVNTTGSLDLLGLSWSFRVAVPLANLSASTAALGAAQKSIAGRNNGLALTFSVAGTQASPELQAAQTCSPLDLIADARAQAQKVAAAAGLVLGTIQGIDAGGAGASFTLGGGFAWGTPANSCSLTVKFSASH